VQREDTIANYLRSLLTEFVLDRRNTGCPLWLSPTGASFAGSGAKA
jgi:hypothetical protein